jgi:signal transduction histidine kinase
MTGLALAVRRPELTGTIERHRTHPVARAALFAGIVLASGGTLGSVLMEREGVPRSANPIVTDLFFGLVVVVPVLVLGTLMLNFFPRHPIGWILSSGALGLALSYCGHQYAAYSHYVDALPASEWVGWVSEWSWASIMLIPAVGLLLFPDGHLPSRRWRPWLWCGVIAVSLLALNSALSVGEELSFQGNPFLSDRTATSVSEPFGLGWILLFPAAIAGAVAIRVRRRSAEGEAREQLRLLGRGALIVVAAFASCMATAFIASPLDGLGENAAVLSLGLLAVTMGVAVLRHRLYGLDVYVDRALVLSGTTIVLGGLYVLAVLGASEFFGQDVDFGVALPATILVAIAFQPLRQRMQARVKRLLYGQRDEPYSAITTLGRRLGDTVAPDQVLPVIVETIAEALRLPYVAVTLDDAPGTPAAAQHGEPVAGVAHRLPLVHAGEHVGTLVIGARTHGESLHDADRRLLEDFAHRASAAASAVAMSVEIQRSRERLVTAREEERRRLRGDLHDGLGPTLAAAILTIDAARRVLVDDPEGADALLDRAAADVEGAVADVRRVVYGLRPPALDQLGLVGALRQQATSLAIGEPSLSCDITAPDPLPPMPAAVEVAVFRIAQEALTNVARHAQAQHASVTITVGTTLELTIRDDGRGMPRDRSFGVGLTSMRERAMELGGSFTISPAGRGTLVRVELPLPAEPRVAG